MTVDELLDRMSASEFNAWIELADMDEEAAAQRIAASEANERTSQSKPSVVKCICPADAYLPSCPIHGTG